VQQQKINRVQIMAASPLCVECGAATYCRYILSPFNRYAGGTVAGDSSGRLAGELAPDAVVAGYQVEARIGAGGMAVVFRARDLGLGRTVALKILTLALADDHEFRERFIRESRAAAAVDHPNIIPVYAAGEADGVLYIAMRYVASGDLHKLIRRDGHLTAERAARLLSPVASALDAGHRAGLVHRDVKPANILVDTSTGMADHPYLADFGVAKGAASTAGLTGTGAFIGTLQYAAPEQISGKRAVPQTDQYALACAVFTMLTGAVPFPREEPSAVLLAHLSEPPPLLTTLRPDLPAAVDKVLARAMAKVAEDRYRTCGEFAEAFGTALASGLPGSGAYPLADLSQVQSGAVPAPHTDTMTSLPLGRPTQPPQVQSDGEDLTADVAGNSAVQLISPAAGRRMRHRLPLIIAATVFAIVVGGGVGLLAAHPWVAGKQPHTLVLAPTGVVVATITPFSMTIQWSDPASGPLPDKYEIVRGAKEIGSVPGTVTQYTDEGVSPGTRYSYRIVAVRGGAQSPFSQTATGQTTTA
jgi:serine/threonine protein kinase